MNLSVTFVAKETGQHLILCYKFVVHLFDCLDVYSADTAHGVANMRGCMFEMCTEPRRVACT